MLFKTLALAAAVGGAVAQRPTNTSICNSYTTALLKNNTSENQKTLLTLVVKTAVIGNCKSSLSSLQPSSLTDRRHHAKRWHQGPRYPRQGNLQREPKSISSHTSLVATNTGGTVRRAVNFLDGGGAAPLMKNMPAEDENSRQ
jgi:hypothetical protein